ERSPRRAWERGVTRRSFVANIFSRFFFFFFHLPRENRAKIWKRLFQIGTRASCQIRESCASSNYTTEFTVDSWQWSVASTCNRQSQLRTVNCPPSNDKVPNVARRRAES